MRYVRKRKMCHWCVSILKKESRFTKSVLDLSINLYLRLVLEDHFGLKQLAWLEKTIPSGEYSYYLSRLLPNELVQSSVWKLLQEKYPSIIKEAIKCSHEARKKRKNVSMELIQIKARASSYLTGNSPSATPNKLNNYNDQN